MKKIALLLILLCIGLDASSQDITLGIKGGLNISTLNGMVNMEPTPKAGILLGVYVDAPVTPKFHIQPELLFSSQGAKTGYLGGPYNGWAVIKETKTTLNYVILPIMAKIYLGNYFNVQLGLQWGLLVSATESDGSLNHDLIESFKGSDKSVIGGFGIDFPGVVNLSTRLAFGTSNINKNVDYVAPGIRRPPLSNEVIQIAIGIPLG
jgi:hypothetical protein